MVVMPIVVGHPAPNGHEVLFNQPEIDTEYDRAKVPPYNGNDPRPPLVV